MTAEELAHLLGREIFDSEDAANFLGIDRNSIEYAAYRGRITYVEYGTKKFYAKDDLLEYARNRGRGRDSKLEAAKVYVVKRSKGRQRAV